MATVLQSEARISNAIDALDLIRGESCNLAVWQRKAPVDVAGLIAGEVNDVRFDDSLAAFESRLDLEMEQAGYPDTPERKALIADAAVLADRFCKLLGLTQLDVRLAIVTTDSCRKFHADYVSARLITTYIGTGTQWLSADDAARVKDGEEPVQLNTLNAGDVGVFKGIRSTDYPAIHRSPPISGTGEKRLLLVLNPSTN